jgi:hypothetical protein
VRKHAFEGLSYWIRDYWKVILLVLGLAAFLIAIGLWATRNHDLPPMEEEGVVVRFGAYSADDGPRPVVLVRMTDGRVLQLGVHRGATQYCRAGSRIGLIRRGDIVAVAPRGCALSTP